MNALMLPPRDKSSLAKRTFAVYESCVRAAEDIVDEGFEVNFTFQLQAKSGLVDSLMIEASTIVAIRGETAGGNQHIPFCQDNRYVRAFSGFRVEELRGVLLVQLRNFPNTPIHRFVATERMRDNVNGRHYMGFEDTTASNYEWLDHHKFVVDIELQETDDRWFVKFIEFRFNLTHHRTLVEQLKRDAASALMPQVIKCAKMAQNEKEVDDTYAVNRQSRSTSETSQSPLGVVEHPPLDKEAH